MTTSAVSPIRQGTGIGAVIGGAIGGAVGLALGLAANPETAWFAVFEVAIPGAMLGALSGLVLGALVAFGRRLDRSASRAVSNLDRSG